jgi:hypothetical protein
MDDADPSRDPPSRHLAEVAGALIGHQLLIEPLRDRGARQSRETVTRLAAERSTAAVRPHIRTEDMP